MMSGARDPLPKLTLGDLALWLLRQRRRFRVTNVSMQPLLQPGDIVLMAPGAYRQSPPQVGDIVVAWHPDRPNLRTIKRVDAVLPDGRLFLLGENRDRSTDSRTFGPVARDRVCGRVTCRWAKGSPPSK